MKTELTEIIFVLDRSGSMAGLEKDTIGGVNGLIEKQCQLEGETSLTLVLFDDKYEVLWDGLDASTVRLSEKDYFVRGMTALLDAVGKTIINVGQRLANTAEEKRPGKVLVVITTDGYENASQEFTYDKIHEMIKHQEEKYNWEFIFMGANIDVEKEAISLGINPKQSFSFEASSEGVVEIYEKACEAIVSMRTRNRS